MRDRIFAEMEPAWKDAYEAGIFTEFMEQRAPGHTVLGDVIYRKGLLRPEGRGRGRRLAALDFLNDPQRLRQAAGIEGAWRSRRTP